MIRKRPLLVVGIASFQLACGAHESGLDPVATQPAKDAAVVDVQEDVQESMDAKEAGQTDVAQEEDTPKKQDRGDPEQFPSSCLDTCQQACASLHDCGGDSSVYPLDELECVERCAMAMSSPYDLWDDVSGHFRCCASQDACFDVATCGGWLAHPAPGSSCEKLCDCLANT
ncbi:MAG TPA: hypothetical protein PKK83_18975 [Polyangiaceae bacterium]|nr:hypothetical protein [Polyangiaceae bacterium]